MAVMAADQSLAQLQPELLVLDEGLAASERALEQARRGVQDALRRRDELEGNITSYRDKQEQRRQRLEWVKGAKEASPPIAAPDPERTRLLAETLRVPEALAALLIQRGMGAPDIARAYLRPELDRLADPGAWAGMATAVDAIVRAVHAGTPILVHGDYDVDGQCAAALLTRTLPAGRATAHPFVPHR